ncbi:MAG: NUDIX hydrolase [Nakamurella sp.]
MSDTPAARIRTAATVILVRDAARGLEVFLLGRVPGMAFAGGVTAFPGGGVDPGDSAVITLTGPDDAWWADHLDADETLARTVVVAAARELFEETGVLLAQLRPEDAERLEDVAAHRLSFAQLLDGRALRADLLRPWARWVTPPGQTRRYDTFFLLAASPEGQHARLLTTEAHAGTWYQPAEALAAGHRGELALLPPTVAMLEELAEVPSVDHALALERRVLTVTPEVISAAGEPLRVRVGDREVAAIGVRTP